MNFFVTKRFSELEFSDFIMITLLKAPHPKQTVLPLYICFFRMQEIKRSWQHLPFPPKEQEANFRQTSLRFL